MTERKVGTHAVPLAATTVASTLGLAAACWVVTVRRMSGMDMGAATDVGSFTAIGLMATLLALGFMSVTWMAVVAGIVFAQKVLPPKAFADGLLALGIVGLGILVAVAPSSVPGLVVPM